MDASALDPVSKKIRNLKKKVRIGFDLRFIESLPLLISHFSIIFS